MKAKKYIISLMTCSMLLGVGYLQPVEAVDFSKDENKYMSLCASGQLTNNNKKTCEDFNSYLKDKNKKLKEELQSQKDEAQTTANSLADAEKKLNSINSSISSKEAEIKYVETTIQNTQNEIDQNNQEIKDRMYVMQSYMNENTFINYVFGANSFTDMLSRIDSFNTLTYSDKELVKGMIEKKKEIENQKVTLENAKKVLESQKVEQAAIQTQYETLLEEQKKKVAATQDAIYDYGAASESLGLQLINSMLKLMKQKHLLLDQHHLHHQIVIQILITQIILQTIQMSLIITIIIKMMPTIIILIQLIIQTIITITKTIPIIQLLQI